MERNSFFFSLELTGQADRGGALSRWCGAGSKDAGINVSYWEKGNAAEGEGVRLLGMKEIGGWLWEDSPCFQSYESYKEVVVQSAADKGGNIH